MTAQPKAAPEQEPDLPPLPPVRAKLNQPKRALVAAGEFLVAAALIWLAFWLWPKGIVTITTTFDDGRPPLTSHRYFGHWISLTIFSGTIAAVLLVDAVRQLMLAARARPKHMA